MATSRVVEKDHGYRDMIARIGKTEKLYVTVGVHGKDGSRGDGELSNAMIYGVHEFGSSDGHVPQRSTLRATIDERAKDIGKVRNKALRAYFVGQISGEQAMQIMGQWVEAAVRQKIVDLRDPPNAPATIAAKGSSNPLIDTSQMKNSVRSVVHRGHRPKANV